MSSLTSTPQKATKGFKILELFGSHLEVRSSSSAGASAAGGEAGRKQTSKKTRHQRPQAKLSQTKLSSLLILSSKESARSTKRPRLESSRNGGPPEDQTMDGTPSKESSFSMNDDENKKLPPFELLPVDVLTRTFLYLYDPRDLLSLSLCGSKYIRKAIRMELIVRAAVYYAGGDIQERMKTIRKLVLDKSIHLPSKFRLLRLITGTQCERGSKCYGYNCVTNKAGKISNPGISAFGMLLCMQCTDVLVTSEPGGAFVDLQTSLARILVRDKSKYPGRRQLIVAQQTEAVSGEPVGPVYDACTHRQLCAAKGGCHNLTISDVLEATNDICESLEYDKGRKEFLFAYDYAKNEHPKVHQAQIEFDLKMSRLEEIENRKRQQEESLQLQFKHLRRIKNKLVGCQHKDLILQHRIKNGKIEFLGPAQCLLWVLMEEPDPPSDLPVTMNQTKDMYALLDRNGFLYGSSNFLKPLKEKARLDVVYQILYEFCIQDIRFFSAMHSRKIELYHHTMDYLTFGNIGPFVVASCSDKMLWGAIRGYFVEKLETETWPEFDAFDLVKFVWENKVEDELKSLGEYSDAYSRLKVFETAVQQIMYAVGNYSAYLRHPSVLDWDPDVADFTIKDELLEITTKGELDLLMDRQFADLLAVHQTKFDDSISHLGW